MNLKVADKDVIVLEGLLTEKLLQLRKAPILEKSADSGTGRRVLREIKMLERLCDRLQRHHGGVGYSLTRAAPKPQKPPLTHTERMQQNDIDEYGALCNPKRHGE